MREINPRLMMTAWDAVETDDPDKLRGGRGIPHHSVP